MLDIEKSLDEIASANAEKQRDVVKVRFQTFLQNNDFVNVPGFVTY